MTTMSTDIPVAVRADVSVSSSIERDPRWDRILRRDRTADGLFWYSVITTGIYCRPSCPSRRPHAENACIHGTVDEARATGARPCRRCDPDGALAETGHNGRVTRACRMIEASETLQRSMCWHRKRGSAPPIFSVSSGVSPGFLPVSMVKPAARNACVLLCAPLRP